MRMRISLMALLLLLSTSIVTASVYENEDTNTRLTWEFTADGELMIDGVGHIPYISHAPWAEYQSEIKKITIGEGITEFSFAWFVGCSSVFDITLPSTLKYFDTDGINETKWYKDHSDGLMYISNWLIGYKGIMPSETTIQIENGTVGVATQAFKDQGNLIGMTIPDGFKYIGPEAFAGCRGLESISFPESIESIGTKAFYNCLGLNSVSLPNTNSLVYFGGVVFGNTPWSLNKPDGLVYLGNWCLYYKGTIESNSVLSLKDGTIGVADEALYNGNVGTGFDNLSNINLPSSLKYLGNRAFYSCKNIKSMIIPEGVLSIGTQLFETCDSLDAITCNALVPPAIQAYTFGYDSLKNCTVYVPYSVVKDYKAAQYWSAYANIQPIKEYESWTSDNQGKDNSVATKSYKIIAPLGATLLFDWYVSSELSYDKLIVTLDDEQLLEVSGEQSGTFDREISQGEHTLVAKYSKDSSGNNGMDQASLFNIKIDAPETAEIDGVFYMSTSDNTVTVLAVDDTTDVVIPANVVINNVTYNVTDIKSTAFSDCPSLTTITIPDGVTEIKSNLFDGCEKLTTVTLPNTLLTIGSAAFKDCSSLRNIIIPDGVTSLGSRYESSSYNYGVFESCYSLRQVILPSGLQEICQRTFYGCRSLTTMDIPEGVTFIGRDAFNGCSNLLSVSMPSTLASCGSTPFANCNKLSEVKCLALLPPMLADGLLTLENMGLPLKRTLKVPEWTINRYKLTSGWAAFTQIEPIKGIYPSSINVTNDAVLTLPTGGLPVNYRPDMLISANGEYMMDGMYNYSASLHLRGSDTLKLNRFTMTNNGMEGLAGTQLLNEAQMEADSVSIRMYLNSYNNGDYYGSSNSGWYFLSFPFDVKISDITTNCEWVVRQYDGKARANNKLESTWMTVPQNATLNAGQGYIWACTGGSFTLYATDNANKNLIFANKKREIPLQEYVAESVSNSSWNLVGNPFPCYYNTNEMDYTAPITVWENNTYAAYSPVDDNYILRPFEAFFVQCPAGVKSVGFKPEGRQLTGSSTSSVPKAAPLRISTNGAGRQVINLTLSSELGSDRTRIVVNDAAKMDYELQCDAAKFMSNDVNMPQLYSVNNGDMFAINERPTDNGIVKLGTHFGVAGTYTIRMQSTGSIVVMLIDNKTGEEVNLTNSDYTFTAETNDINRFDVRMYVNENVTAVEPVVTKTNVSAIGNIITVTTFDEANVEIYTAAGSLIDAGKGQYLTFEVVSGIYIVKVNGESHKVTIVK